MPNPSKPKSKAASQKPATSSPKKQDKRKIEHPEVTGEIRDGKKGEPLTIEGAKKITGWLEEPKKGDFGQEYDLLDEYGNKVRLRKNARNRPYDAALAKAYQGEILNGHWRLNGEAIVIGLYDTLISGQHRLAGLILAVQRWEKDGGQEAWPKWKTPPVLPCIIIYGIDEEDDVVNTIDSGKRRSVADVLYRSELFADCKASERLKRAKIAEFAVKMVWYRTGASLHAFAPNRVTNMDALDFLQRHIRLRDAANAVFDMTEGDITKYLTPGYAAGMLYLMAQGKSNPDEYRQTQTPNEDQLDWELWDKALDFLQQLAKGSRKLEAANTVRERLIHDELATRDARCALVSKTWLAYQSGKKITPDDVKVNFQVTEGSRVLTDFPSVGGIDLGVPKPKEIEEPDAVEEDDEEAATGEGENFSVKKPKTAKTAKEAKPIYKVKQKVWVVDDDGSSWNGIIVELYDDLAKVRAANGKPYETPVANLQLEEPV